MTGGAVGCAGMVGAMASTPVEGIDAWVGSLVGVVGPRICGVAMGASTV